MSLPLTYYRIPVRLQGAFFYPILRGYARLSTRGFSTVRSRASASSVGPFVRENVQNAGRIVCAVGALMTIDIASWFARLESYGPDKMRLKGVCVFVVYSPLCVCAGASVLEGGGGGGGEKKKEISSAPVDRCVVIYLN